jgi:hypothetical protein
MALSRASSHSWVLYLLPAGSEVVARGSSKVMCFSRFILLAFLQLLCVQALTVSN